MPVKSTSEQAKRTPEVEAPQEVETIYNYWEEIVDNPEEWLSDLEGELAFVAGGGLPLVFGDEDSEIWQAMLKAIGANDQELLNIAGIDFSRSDFEVLGDFYRFLKQKGYSLHCIDERLEDDVGTKNTEVHQHCGACAATHSQIQEYLSGDIHVEDLLLRELGLEAVGKQEIYDSMPQHESITIFVDFSGDDAIIDPQKRADLREIGGLAFQVSLPSKLIQEYNDLHNLQGDKKDQLLSVLINWNAGIARNIIGGQHNALQEHAEQTQLIIDQRELSDQEQSVNQLMEELKDKLLKMVAHGRVLEITQETG